MPKDKVYIFDTTLRDGEQSAGAMMNTQEKLEIARNLERLGIDIIEAGFAASSPGDLDAIKTIAKEIREPIIASLARAHPNDVDKAWEAVQHAKNPRIHIFLSSSDIQIMHMLHKNRDEILEMSISNVARAKNYLDDVQFSPMDATRTEPEYLYALLEAVIDAGATTVNIPDTVGYSIPSEFGKLLIDIQKNVKNINKARLSVHCHNDLGLSVANSLAAVQAGARQVEGCINGLGERAGNAATEEIIMALATRKDYFGVNIEIDTTQLTRTSRLVSEITGFAVQKNKAIVGLNAFRHASGIHQDGILKEKSTYEIIDPISVGLASNSLVLAKLSGRAGLRARLEELGYKLSTEDLDLTFLAFKDLADKKREITDRDLEALMGEQRRITQMNNFQIIDVEVHTGSKKKPSATVTLANSDGVKFSETCDGNGPVDAVCKAIATVIGIHPTLEEYSVRSITGELDAVGDVTVKLNYNNQLFSGRGADTDIILASAKAYTNAINRMLA